MNFLVLLLVLWVEKFSAWRNRIQNDGHWLRFLATTESKPRWAERPWLALALLVLLPLLALWLILLLLPQRNFLQ